MIQNVERHEHSNPLHGAHVKYGYIVFAASVIWLLFTALAHNQQWIRARRKTRTATTVFGLVWLACISFALFNKSLGLGLNFFAKRCGRVVYALLPIALATSLRPSLLPCTSYIDLMVCHKWVSRLSVILGAIHGVSYLVYFAQSGKLYKLAKVQNILGVVGLASMLIMAIVTLRPLRRRFYQATITTHSILAVTTVILGAIHARPGVIFLFVWCAFLIVLEKFRRVRAGGCGTSCKLDIENVSKSLRLVRIPRDVLPQHFPAGSHIRLQPEGRWFHPLRWFSPTHPYTVASLDSDDELLLLVRRTRLDLHHGAQYQVVGPYVNNVSALPSEMDASTLSERKVLIIAGGSGLSMAAPLKRYWDLNSIEARIVWVVRIRSDVPALNLLHLTSDFVVYVTGESSPTQRQPVVNPAFKHDEEIELEDLLQNHDDKHFGVDGLDDEDDLNFGDKSETSAQIPIIYGRPNFDKALEGFVDPLSHSSALVVGCGPSSLVSDVKKWARRENLPFIGEVYSL